MHAQYTCIECNCHPQCLVSRIGRSVGREGVRGTLGLGVPHGSAGKDSTTSDTSRESFTPRAWLLKRASSTLGCLAPARWQRIRLSHPLACNHVSTPSFCSTPPLIPSLRPHLLHTYDPPGPYFVPMRMAGDVAGPMLRLLGEPDTPNAPECGPSDAQDA